MGIVWSIRYVANLLSQNVYSCCHSKFSRTYVVCIFQSCSVFVFQTIAEYVNYVETEMKSCEEEECKLLYVRSMGNAGLAKFLPSLLNQALNSKSSTVSLTAIQGLRRMKISDFNDQVVTI